jgi:HAD superfamily hydrolase (TIGR01459 family)
MTMTQEKSLPHYLQSLKEVAAAYDGFLIDIWGVIHNGVVLYPDVLDTLQWLQESNKKTLLLSNAPRRLHLAKQKLAELGLAITSYGDIYTSGEDCHQALRNRSTPWHQNLGNKFYHLGPERDRTIFLGLDAYTEAQDVATADFVLITGTLHPMDTVADYETLLNAAHRRQLPVLCANPDRYVVYGSEKIICAGKLAEAYQTKGGDVYYHGKPYPAIYAAACAKLGVVSQKILAIGDSLSTDIQGAQGAGIDTLWILNGIHRTAFYDNDHLKEDIMQQMPRLLQDYGLSPTYAMAMLR